jgi:hypothetical protein
MKSYLSTKFLFFWVLAFASLGNFGCSSISRYTKGKVQKGSLPPTSIVLLPVGPKLSSSAPVLASCGVDTSETRLEEVSGTLIRLYPFKKAPQGFRLELKAKEGIWILDVKTHVDVLPRLETQKGITVSLLTGSQTTLVIEDDKGIAFYLWCGEEALLKETPLIKVEPSAVQAFTEVKSSGPCEVTEVVTKVLVSDERNAVFVEPSKSVLFERDNRQFVFVLLDSRFVDESQCGEITPPKVAFFIARVAPQKQVTK